MRGAALLVALAGLATCSGVASANILKTVDKQQALDRALHHVLQQRRPANASSNDSVGAAPGAGRGAKLGEELSRVQWLRYTQPRLITSVPEHTNEAVTEAVLTQPLAHEDQDSATWQQRYFRCSDSYEAGGPAFVMLSGTADYQVTGGDWLREGFMATLARKYKADRFFLPTRFFSANSHPTADTSVDSLRHLTVENVLLDVASFLDQLREAGVLKPQQKVVLFGAGFGGAVAAWARQRFPDVIHGVVASSATLEPRLSVPSYFPVVSRAADWYHKRYHCADLLQEAFEALERGLSTADGRNEFNRAFGPCTPLPETTDGVVSDLDRAHILGLVASVFADLVQEDVDGPQEPDYPLPGGDLLRPYCVTMFNPSDPPLRMLGLLVSYTHPGVCLDTSYSGLVKALSPSGWSDTANRGGARPWLWLQCTQLGQFPDTTGSTDTFPYSTRITPDFYINLCRDVFDKTVTKDNLINSISDLNKHYGGLKPDISNAIFVKGDLDPWRGLSPDTATGAGVHVFSVLRASHAHDLFPRDDYDPPWMKKTRKAVERLLAGWLA
ncbi:putative serine protease K12H4.7 [Thrips palmi]|uniref:Serine protease K12H4.7 n=1 Tax=Thrips palmi TaxID=161013 RepID=A0A6P8YNH2_THRPL|nr:putative serine protease K12H4.7 [Thrips palmi]